MAASWRHRPGLPAGPGAPVRQAILSAVAVLALTGCASAARLEPTRVAPGATGSRAAAATASGTGAARPASTGSGCPHGSGFALSLADGYAGWATPVQAAQQFSRHGDPAGYGTVSTVWTAGAASTSGVSLTAGSLTLHAVRLPNGRWAIDSGQRCDS